MFDDIDKKTIDEIEFNFQEFEYYISKFNDILDLEHFQYMASYYTKEIIENSETMIKNLRALAYSANKDEIK